MIIQPNMIELPKLRISLKSFLKGKQIDGFELRESHTWVRNMYVCVLTRVVDTAGDGGGIGDGELNYKNTAGNISAYANSGQSSTVWGAMAGDAGNGPVVGTGVTAWSFDDFKLATLIAHGNGSGQLSYVQGSSSAAWVGDVITVTGTRYFNNNSGAGIGVNEAGLYCYNGSGTIMSTRDVLGSTVTVANTGQLLLTYEITGDCSP